MKCEKCKERNGSARCEGCKVLFCLTCFTQHHDELFGDFQRLMDERNRTTAVLQEKQMKNENNEKFAPIVEINRWETEMIERIRQIAAEKRNEIQQIIRNDFNQQSQSLEKLTSKMQQYQKDGICLETDLSDMRKQLEEIQSEINELQQTIDVTISNRIDLKSMVQIKKRAKEDDRSTQRNPTREDIVLPSWRTYSGQNWYH